MSSGNNKIKLNSSTSDLRKINRLAYKNINLSPVIVNKTMSRTLKLKRSNAETPANDEKEGSLESPKLFPTNQLLVMARATRKFKQRKSLTMLELKMPSKPFHPEENVRKETSTHPLINTEQIIMENYNLNTKYFGYKALYLMSLKAWRKRKSNVDNLMRELKRANHNSKKIDSQLHMMSTLYENERKRYEISVNEAKNTRALLEKMKGDVNSAESEKLHLKFQYELEVKNYVEMVKNLKSDLKKSTISLHTLEYNWENSKNDIKDLLVKIDRMEGEIVSMIVKEEKAKTEHEKVVSKKDLEIKNLKDDLEILKKKYKQNKIRDSQIKEYQKYETVHLEQIQLLTNQLIVERERNVNSFSSKLFNCMAKIPRRPLWYLQFVTEIMIPPVIPLSATSAPLAKENIIREVMPSTSPAL